uniref:Wall-associated receptor kinase galacturonan-binding domain-containing protein n=1 Tax=Aegilops tauschii TaxID=37682 RepID=M8CF89_AEGTA
MPQAVLLLAVSCAAVLAAGVSGQPVSPAAERTNCPAKCGDVEIHYPFGIGPGCSMDADFEVTCNETTSPPSLQLGNILIANITLETAQMVVYTFLTYSCRVPGSNNTIYAQTQSMELSVSSTTFLVSPSDNVFTSVGCNSLAQLVGHSGTDYHTGCITTGHGCCEASIMPGLFLVNVSWSDWAEESDYHVPGNLCQYAFVATKGWSYLAGRTGKLLDFQGSFPIMGT